MFRFKRFIVDDAACAMKVGTDGVLLGAWTPLDAAPIRRVLDVGTGSGLIALMLAQRTESTRPTILGIDVDEAAAAQAAANFRLSPWADRLQAAHLSLQELTANGQHCGQMDLIVSNPPYFIDSLKNPDAGRRLARHTDTLSFDELMRGSAALLAEHGTLALIAPADEEQHLTNLAAAEGLLPYNITRVRTRTGKAPKRVMMAFSRQHKACREDHLNLLDETSAPRSAQYQQLCENFYL